MSRTIPNLRGRLSALTAVLAAGCFCLLAACGDHEDTEQIGRVRDLGPAGGRTMTANDSQDRFGGGPHGTEAPRKPTWGFETPDGWKQLPSAPMRDLGWQAPGGVEVTFAALGGTGGGLVANVNRWRDQMGLEHVEDAAVADLPRADLMGQSAILVDLDGTYGGMGGPTKIEGAKLLGLIAELPRAALFLKMTGPAEAVEAQRDAFLFLGHSIRMGPPTPAEGLPPGHGMRPPAAGETQGSSAVSWSVPKDWKPTGGRTAFREATFVPEGHPDTEAWVSVLAGDGGGLLENINRWRRQMGQSALGDAEVRSLPQLEANGREGTLVTIHGSYDAGSMSSHQGKIEDATMLGFVLMRGGDSVFVKMVGPTDQVTAERGAFEAFVRSLRAP